MEQFSWDEQRSESLKKHGVAFEMQHWFFMMLIKDLKQDRFENGEYRWQTEK
jgi:uncharacterized DUF497 family protein